MSDACVSLLKSSWLEFNNGYSRISNEFEIETRDLPIGFNLIRVGALAGIEAVFAKREAA